MQRVGEHQVGPANYSGLDEVIDSLRRGDKMPSDRSSTARAFWNISATPMWRLATNLARRARWRSARRRVA